MMTNEKTVQKCLPLDRKGVVAAICVAQSLVVLPLIFQLPFWISAISMVAIAWRLASHFRHWPLPGKWLRLSAAMLGTALIIVQHHSLISKEAGLSLFVVMTSLRLMELKRYRDGMNSILLCFFLLGVNFLYNQSLLITVYAFITLFWLLISLIALQRIDGLEYWKVSTKLSLKQLVYTIPFAIFMFVFFPRLSHPLWNMPNAQTAGSGVSDSMTPGDISQLLLNDDIAFRAKFLANTPSANSMYWRGLVLADFDGLTWRRSPSLGVAQLIDTEQPVEYQILLEPHQHQWLYFLDMPSSTNSTESVSRPVGNNEQYIYPLPEKLLTSLRYTGRSFIKYRANPLLTSAQKNHYTKLPRDGNERSQQWAKALYQKSVSPQDFVHKILTQINQKEYYYTLIPPVLAEDTIDDFWFNTHKGFCEHYASTLVYLARAVGIPARVVVGYQGGEKNPYSDYWVVKQSDAHAWTEIWYENQGWVRVDPTAAIHPSRVEQRVSDSYRQREPLFDSDLYLDWVPQKNSMFKTAQQLIDLINTQWKQWVIDYNQQNQMELLKWLGFKDLSLTVLIRLLVGTSFVIIFIWGLLVLSVGKKEKLDEMTQLYLNLCDRLNRLGCSRKNNEGPSDFQKRIEKRNQQWAAISRPIIEAYIASRYCKMDLSKEHIAQLKTKLAQL